ncbi:hypothetical protein T4C_4450 [Trichinella pseudospiralis]|uniref:Uncharacterized protein n=1 Tax=Trichinella pseudospiralis TaxID=6337 RepID=A0A0V1G916_TRIPS|nr:hypothetical protein T4C_9687 [Trichinella pseudospiralis]KRY95928.1 hypothetical protein T4C_4450 [Trichinella pseudospiralis]
MICEIKKFFHLYIVEEHIEVCIPHCISTENQTTI